MPGYTNDQIDTLESLVQAANASLRSGDQASALEDVNQYYSLQTSMRGFASDALLVINNTGIFGEVANLELTDALGASNYQAQRASIAIALATADFGIINSHTNAVPTENEISSYHYEARGGEGSRSSRPAVACRA